MKEQTGVIVGRFQVSQLHQGHRDLIDFVCRECRRVLIVLGTPRSYATERNPLSFALRAAMIQKLYPGVSVVQLADHPSDKVWAEQLDELIATNCPDSAVTLYGSRDSFLEVYTGRYATQLFQPNNGCNGTASRKKLAESIKVSRGFLAGLIYQQETRAAIAYPTVDIAILQDGKVLLAGKSDFTDKLFFIGGFVDATDSSLELAARREICEETGMEVGNLRYIGSTKVDDWRYRGAKDGIITSFFCAKYIFGALKPSDDVTSLEWVPLDEMEERLAPEHKPLARMLKRSLS